MWFKGDQTGERVQQNKPCLRCLQIASVVNRTILSYEIVYQAHSSEPNHTA